ncbi:MAG TPA: glutamine-hydrolyzing GMP synthase [Candidatus Saccharimonadales bacterium]|nr:glutamine-hydrolyzing GMP synthase [Candidatus Saccharimonadales bacterium]
MNKVRAAKAQGEGRIAILDAGAQYGKVIDRRVRNLAVRSDLLPLDTPYGDLKTYEAFIISGGPESVYAPEAPKPDPEIWKSGKPILGICYGMQLINQAFGGSVERKSTREDGHFAISVTTGDLLFKGLQASQKVLMSHGDSIAGIAKGFSVTATSGDIVAAISNPKLQIYGVQFHPEVDLTDNGKQMLANFLFGVCELKPDYSLENRLDEATRYIQENVGNRDVLVFASGGVDSTVCAALVGRALPPDKVHVVHIDTGLMRYQESRTVAEALEAAGVPVKVVQAEEQFLNGTTIIDGKATPPLREVDDPEVKRRIIGDTFMKIREEVLADLKLNPKETVLAQGTLRPDLIESASHLASAKAAVIKTHHNDTQLVRDLRESGHVIEPLHELHKDEVRQLGEQLGLPHELVWRQPFPGPGLGIRLLCARKPYITEDFDRISKELKKFEDDDIAAHLLPVRTVGVQGDGRTYSYLVGLSGTADWPRLFEKAREIPKALHDVNRVVYIFGDKLTGPIKEITPTLPTPDAIGQLREADRVVNDILMQYDLIGSLSQVPVISFPVNFGQKGKRSIGIRTFITNDFMTGVPALPGEGIPQKALNEMVAEVQAIKGIARVVYDLTSKPPGTTEWE